MNFTFFFQCFLIIISASAHEFVRDSLKRINWDLSPCDDFYRHVCPTGDFDMLIDHVLKPIINDLQSYQMGYVWENLNIKNALMTMKFDEIPDTFTDYVIQIFEEICNGGYDTTELLIKIQQIVRQTTEETCDRKYCLTHLAGDKNCSRSTGLLAEHLKKYLSNDPFSLSTLRENLQIYLTNIRAVSSLLDGDFIEGVQVMKNFMSQLKEIAIDLIEKTPWVQNQGIEKAIKRLTEDIKMGDNFIKDLRNNIELLFEMETKFLKCMQLFSPGHSAFCLAYVERLSPSNDGYITGMRHNAANSHPNIFINFPLYTVAAGSDQLAAKIGLVGQVLGHELAHTLIEDREDQRFLPYSSAEAIECIQKQFNSTCAEYEETSCEIKSLQIDDNGADVLGLQLAHYLFENHFMDRKNETYLDLTHGTITMEQLFFYGAALTLCHGKPSETSTAHAARNIRINVMASHPAFQSAFQCSPDSRIMKTVEKDCVVYGENAPQQRRR